MFVLERSFPSDAIWYALFYVLLGGIVEYLPFRPSVPYHDFIVIKDR